MTTQPEVVMKFKLGQPVEVRVNGVKGKACKAFSRPFEEAIGGTVKSTTPTVEMTQGEATVGLAEKATQKKTF